MLVVENAATFHTLATLAPADSPLGFVAYGGGNAFPATVEFVRDLPDVAHHGGPITDIRYFGDLDMEGLDVARRAAETRAPRRARLPPVLPAVGLYARLFRVGVPQSDAPVAPAKAEALVEWLPVTLREVAFRTLVDGGRLRAGGRRHGPACGRSDLHSWASLGPRAPLALTNPGLHVAARPSDGTCRWRRRHRS